LPEERRAAAAEEVEDVEVLDGKGECGGEEESEARSTTGSTSGCTAADDVEALGLA
jgi:hypothetical protein